MALRTRLAYVLICLLASPEIASPQDAIEIKVEFRLAELQQAEGLTEMNTSGAGLKIYAHPKAALTNDDIVTAIAVERGSQPVIETTLTSAGAKKFALLTENRIGKPVAVIINGKLVSAPVIQAPIRSGRVVIGGRFTFKRAQRIAEAISTQGGKLNGRAPQLTLHSPALPLPVSPRGTSRSRTVQDGL